MNKMTGRIEGLERRRLLASAVSFSIYLDSNRNGVQDAGETTPPRNSTAYASMYLDRNNDGVRNVNESAIFGSGTTMLLAGTYVFRMELLGYRQTEPANAQPITLTVDGTSPAQMRFGVVSTAAKLEGRFFYDVNANGLFDVTTDVPNGASLVFLDLNGDSNHTPASEPSVMTGADGRYSLTISTAFSQLAALRVNSLVPLALPGAGFWPIDISPYTPALIENLDFSFVRRAAEPFVVAGSTLVALSGTGGERLTIGRDPADDALVVDLDGAVSRHAAGAITKVQWLSAGGVDTLVAGDAGVSIAVTDLGPGGAAELVGTDDYDRFSLSMNGVASLIAGSRATSLSWVSTDGALPDLTVDLVGGADSATLSTALSSGNNGFASATISGGDGVDAMRCNAPSVVLYGNAGDDRFYIGGDPGSQTVFGGDGVDAAQSDSSDLLDGIEQGATARLSGGNFTDEDTDGLFAGQTAGGWVNGCPTTNNIRRSDWVEADPKWQSADGNFSGGFALTDLLPGTYVVTGTIDGPNPQLWYPTSPNGVSLEIVLAEGETNLRANLGWALRSSFQVSAFLDVDGNGLMNGVDQRQTLNDRVVWLDLDDDGERDAGEPTTTDNYQGFPVTSLRKGSYIFRSTPVEGWAFTGASGARVVYVVDRSAQTTPLLFGQRPPTFDSGVSGRVTLVPAGLHVSPDGVGLPARDRAVYLDYDDDRQMDFDELRTNTDVDGRYHFDGLPPFVWLAVRLSNVQANVAERNFEAKLSLRDGSKTANFADVLPVVPSVFNSVVKFVDDGDPFTDRVPDTMTLFAYVDLNGDGVRQPGERSARVEPSGYFSLTVASADASKIRVDVPPGFVLQKTFPYGTGYPALRLQPASNAISGRVLLDIDSTASVDRSDPTLDGRLVYIDLDDDAVLDAGEPQTVSDNAGAFTFFEQVAGPKKIRAATDATFGVAGSYTLASFAGTAWITTADILIIPPAPAAGIATLSGQVTEYTAWSSAMPPIRGIVGQRVYVDYDGDGTRDAGEPSVVAGANGTFFIPEIIPGTYSVRVETVRGWSEDGIQTREFIAGKHVQCEPLVKKGFWHHIASGISLDEATPTAWYRFDDDVSASLYPGTCSIITASGTLLYATAVRWDPATSTATWVLPASLNDVTEAFIYISNWTIWSESQTNSSQVINPQWLRITRGDITGDGVANFDDLLIVSQNYGRSGRTYSQGNLDRDPEGRVDFDDLLIVAQSYQGGAFAIAAGAGSMKKVKRTLASETIG